jgi:hypothetical protein
MGDNIDRYKVSHATAKIDDTCTDDILESIIRDTNEKQAISSPSQFPCLSEIICPKTAIAKSRSMVDPITSTPENASLK